MSLRGEDALILAMDYTEQTLKGQGALKGEDGISPTISVNTSTSDIYKLDITDKNGTITTPNLVGKQGERGEIGQTGADGETPTITENADNTEEIYKLDFTTKNGTFTTKNIQGKQGLEGVSPSVTTNPDNTAEDYRLNITTKGGTFTTPNLRGPKGEQGPIGESAASAINPRGDYDVNAEPHYTISDYITSAEGNTYVCKKDNPSNVAPTDGTVNDEFWQILALRGAQGLPGKDGEKGADGVTFTPSIDENGILSFTNNGGLENPNPIDIKGDNGVTFTPSIDAEGYLSFTNNGNLENPEPIKVLGQDGADGKDGIDGTTYIPSIGTVTTVESNAEASAGVTVDQETKEAVFHFEIPKGEKATQFTPSITENGELAWENDGDLPNPPTTPIQTLISTAPLGTVLSFAGNTAPNGYLLCDGASYKVADYEDLYAVIGNTYGGDSTNFNVPDYRETVLVGVGVNTTDTITEHDVYELGEFKDDQFQDHTHSISNVMALGKTEYYDGAKQYLTTSNSTGNANSGRSGATTHGKQKGVTYIIKAKHTNEGQDEGVSDSVIEYVDGKIIDTTTSTDTVWSSKKTSDEIAKHSLPIAFDSGIINNSTVQVYKLANVGYTASGGTDAYNLNLLLSSRGAEEIELIGGKNDGGWIIEAIRNNKSFNKITNIYQDGLDIYVRLDLRCNYFRVYHKSGVLSGDFAVSLVDTVPESATELTINSASIDDTKSSTTSTYSSAKIDELNANRQVKAFKNSGSTAKYYKICSAITAGYPYNIKATTGRIDSTVSVEYFSAIFRDSRYNYTSQVVLDGRFAYNQSVSTYKEYCPCFIVDANQDLYLYVPSYSQTTIEIDTRAITIDGTEGTPIEDYVYNSFDHRFDERINDSATNTNSTWSSSKIASTMPTTRSLTLKSGYSGYITEVYDPTTKVVVYNVNVSGTFKGLLNSVADGFKIPKGSTSSSDVMHKAIGIYGSDSAMNGDAQFTRLLVRNYGNPHLEVDVNAENTIVSGTITYVTA